MIVLNFKNEKLYKNVLFQDFEDEKTWTFLIYCSNDDEKF